LEIELDRKLIKEATLSYCLRKAAEIDINLRQEFAKADPLELSVISRPAFWGILIGLPLGLNESELTEIFDNDLLFDNYGNVNYTAILLKEEFVVLESRRIKAHTASKAREAQKKRVRKAHLDKIKADGGVPHIDMPKGGMKSRGLT
jgi:hypothetical protein